MTTPRAVGRSNDGSSQTTRSNHARLGIADQRRIKGNGCNEMPFGKRVDDGTGDVERVG